MIALITDDLREPTADDAADLIRAIAGAGTVGRLDVVHAALRAAYRRGKCAERAEAQATADQAAERFAAEAQLLATQHAREFVEAVTKRGAEGDALLERPWYERPAM